MKPSAPGRIVSSTRRKDYMWTRMFPSPTSNRRFISSCRKCSAKMSRSVSVLLIFRLPNPAPKWISIAGSAVARGCNVCKHTGWVEILGSGMVHPKMLREFRHRSAINIPALPSVWASNASASSNTASMTCVSIRKTTCGF